MNEGKSCTKCGEVKPYEAFSRRAKASDGRQPWCKKCAHAHRLAWAKENTDKVRGYRIWDAYGIRQARWQEMYQEQDGHCAICYSTGELVVDHDHGCCPGDRGACGRCVRGLVCRGCNILIGQYERATGTLEKIALYVKEHQRR